MSDHHHKQSIDDEILASGSSDLDLKQKSVAGDQSETTEIIDDGILASGSSVLDRKLKSVAGDKCETSASVETPDSCEREDYLNERFAKESLSVERIDLGEIAAMTDGYTRAELANLVNKAALLAERQKKAAVNEVDIVHVVNQVIKAEIPDIYAREIFLKLHVARESLPVERFDLGDIAAMTVGFTRKELANLVKKAALLAERQKGAAVDKVDFVHVVKQVIKEATYRQSNESNKMELPGNSPTYLVKDADTRFVELTKKARALEDKMGILAKEEEQLEKRYGNIFLTVYVKTGFFVTFSGYLVGLYIKEVAPYWMFSLIASVIFCFVVGVLCPIGFAYRQLSGLKFTCKKLIEERENIQKSCTTLLREHDEILSNIKNEDNEDHANENRIGEDNLLKNIKDFTQEDIVPKFWKKYNRNYILALGLCCLMFTLMVLSYGICKTIFQGVQGPVLTQIPSPTLSGPLVSPLGPADALAFLSRPVSSLPRKILM